MALPGRSSFAHLDLRPRLLALLCIRRACRAQGTDAQECRQGPMLTLRRRTQRQHQTQRLHVSHSCPAAPTAEQLPRDLGCPRNRLVRCTACYPSAPEQRIRVVVDFAMFQWRRVYNPRDLCAHKKRAATANVPTGRAVQVLGIGRSVLDASACRCIAGRRYNPPPPRDARARTRA